MTLHLQQKGCSCGGDCRSWSLGDTPRSLRCDVGLREEQCFMGWGGRGQDSAAWQAYKTVIWALETWQGHRNWIPIWPSVHFQALQGCFCLFSLSEFPKTVPQWSSYLFVKCGLIALRETLMEHSLALKPPSSTASHLCRKWVQCNYMGKNDAGRGGIPSSKHKHYRLCGLYVEKECKFESSSSHLRWGG